MSRTTASLAVALVSAALLAGQETTPQFLHGHDFRVRPGGERVFSDKTPRVGVEFYYDPVHQAVVAISEKGRIAVAPAPPGVAASKTFGSKWLFAHDLDARKAGEAEFTQKTRKFGVEVFRDLAANRLVYVCESQAVAMAPVPAGLVTDRGPRWHHALELKVRDPSQGDFEKAARFGVEAYRDENTPDGLIYIVAETGAIATATPKGGSAPPPAAPKTTKEILHPKHLHGLILRVRRGDEPEFTDQTARYGVEVFEDPNAGRLLVFISQSGDIAVTPPPASYDPKVRGVTWKHSLSLRARPSGDKTFDKARRYGIEVFQDNRTGCLVYICETGSIAVLPPPPVSPPKK